MTTTVNGCIGAGVGQRAARVGLEGVSEDEIGDWLGAESAESVEGTGAPVGDEVLIVGSSSPLTVVVTGGTIAAMSKGGR